MSRVGRWRIGGGARFGLRAVCRQVSIGSASLVVLAFGGSGCSSDEPKESDGAAGGAGAASASGSGGTGGASGSASSTGGGGAVASGGSASGSGGGGAGGAMTGAGGVSTNEEPTCLPVLSSCDVTNDCCAGSVCVEGRCRGTCADDAECSTGCCYEDPAVGHKICAAMETCELAACPAEGEPCMDDGTCCGEHVCAEIAPGQPVCRVPCQADGDCDSGCCAASGFCADALVCSCVGKGETCSGATVCCEGLACSTFDSSGAFACQTLCSDDADCGESECCRPIKGTGNNVCLTGSFCF